MKELPKTAQIEAEYKRVKYRRRFRSVLRSTIYTLITVAAIAVLVATLWMPVLRIYGSSMSPTLINGDLVISLKDNNLETGEIVAFYHNNMVLVKRVIAGPGDWVNIDKDGTVYVNEVKIDEPEHIVPDFGDTNIELPYQVPENRWFVLGDHRSVSIDSRNTAVGCVSEEQVVGKLVFCVWPAESFGIIE